MPEKIYKYCPYCGKRLVRSSIEMPNFCTFCGKKLKENTKEIKKKVRCTICHEFIDPNRQRTIKCSFCGSMYHTTCVASWLLKYNACPMCQNVFIFPDKIIALGK